MSFLKCTVYWCSIKFLCRLLYSNVILFCPMYAYCYYNMMCVLFGHYYIIRCKNLFAVAGYIIVQATMRKVTNLTMHCPALQGLTGVCVCIGRGWGRRIYFIGERAEENEVMLWTAIFFPML